MSTVPENELEVVEGHVFGLFVTERDVEFIVARQRARVRKTRVTASLRQGDHVRLVLGDPLFGQRMVLALHRTKDGATEYLGPGIGWKTVLLSAIGCVIAIYIQSPWLMILATGPVLGLHGAFAHDRRRTFDFVKARAWRHFTSPSSSDAPESDDLPLSLTAGKAADPAQWHSPILEFTHDAIIMWEMEGSGIVYWNRAAERLYGYSREEALGKVTHDLLKTQIEGGVEELENRLERYGIWVGLLRHTRSDGGLLHVEARLSLMSQEHRPWLVLEVNRDVTDRERAETDRTRIGEQLRRLRAMSRSRR